MYVEILKLKCESCRFRKGMKINSGKLAKIADGCAVATLGDTSVMVTTVGKAKCHPSVASFVPLTVDYREKSAAAGRIPTNYLRREMGFTEREILTSRLIDRSIRPLFPEGYNWDTQLICNLLAVDGVQDPDVISINAASAALSLSDIPWNGPIGAVRVGMIDNELVVNPNRSEITQSVLNMVVVSASQNLVVMLDATADSVLQPEFLKAIKKGVQECQAVVQGIKKLAKEEGKPKREITEETRLVISDEVMDAARTLSEIRIRDIFRDSTLDKMKRDNQVSEVRTDVVSKLKETFSTVDSSVLTEAFSKVTKSIFRDLILQEKIRCDGRNVTQLRNISCEVDLYKPLHGSALFQRGQTQVFCTVAFDSLDSALRSSPMSVITGGMKEKNFFLHYEFPPYAVSFCLIFE